MRAMIYGIAILAAVGIMAAIALTPATVDPADDSAAAAAATEVVMQDAGALTLAVPEMHCPFACYPAVKETLEKLDGVSEVTLDQQKEEGVIDNRQVVVKYQPGFDLTAAIDSLAKKGFSGANVVQ